MVDLVDQYANKSLALGWLLVVMRICAINLHAAEINFQQYQKTPLGVKLAHFLR